MKNKKVFFKGSLDIIERVGNKLPDPFVLFVGLALLMVVVSYIFSLFNASVVHPGSGEEIPIKIYYPVMGYNSY